MPTGTPDAVTVEILANMCRAVVDEMAWVLLRSSHTTFVKETQDFSTGLVTPEGEMFAAPHTKGATVLMGIPMAAGTRAFDDWQEGDVVVANDPYATGGMVMHLNDLYVFRPIIVDGKLLCFAWAFIHCTDVGGAVPGSISMTHHEIHQEGTRLRPVRLFRNGQLNEDVWNIFADNSRIPDLNWGDVSALLSALAVGEQRVKALVDRHSRPTFADAMYRMLDNTEHLTRQTLERIPAGTYVFDEYFEDDYVTEVPVRIHLAMTARGDGTVELDFTGSDSQVRAAINLPSGGHRHHPFLCLALINFAVTHAEGLHLNAGILRCIDLVLPESSVVSCSYPAACGMRYTTAMRVHEIVLGALSQAVPDLVPAGGSSQVVVNYISTSQFGGGGRVVVANPVQGGTGAGIGLDGESAIDFPAAFLRNVPVEVLEAEAPTLVHRLRLRPDSEGAGRLRGGFGVEYALQVLHPNAEVVMRGKDRLRFSSWGSEGGNAGDTSSCTIVRGDGSTADIGKQTVYGPQLDDVIHITTGGGGGRGPAIERDPDAVAADVHDGLVSRGRAAEVYGVALNERQVDEDATARLRAAMASDRATGFDLGPGRTAWERRHRHVVDLMPAWLSRFEPSVRRQAQVMVYELLSGTGSAEVTPGEVDEALATVADRLSASVAQP